jgi:hypothetical protein
MRYGSEKIQAPRISAGAVGESQGIPRVGVLHSLVIYLTATLTVTGGTGVGTIVSDGLFRFLKRFGINAAGAPMQSWDGRWLFLVSRLFFPTTYEQTPVASLAAGASNNIALTLEVPFFMPHSSSPDEFALPAQFAATPEMIADYGTAADLVTGADGALTLSGLALEVRRREIQGIPPSPNYSALIARPYERTVDATSSDLEIDFQGIVPGMEIRAVLVRAEVDGEYNDTVINRLALHVDDKPIYHSTAWNLVRNLNKVAYNLDSRLSGVAVIDAAEDGQTGPRELYNVRTPTLPKIVCDVTKPGAGVAKIKVLVLATDRGVAAAGRSR